MNKIVKIIITNNYKLNCLLIDSIDNQNIIEIIKDYSLTISLFNQNSIEFIQQWIESPEDYSTYTVELKYKEYQLLPEVFFALIISEIKNKIEREYIIENTILEIPSTNKEIIKRMKISLQAIEMKGVELEEDENITFDYSIQGEYLEQ